MSNTNTKLKFQSFLLTTDHINAMVKAMKQAGLRVERDRDAGTVRAFHNDTEVYGAIQKGTNQPWIVRHVVDLFS
jgi:hypothetical protein